MRGHNESSGPVLHVRSSAGFYGAESVLTTLLKRLPAHGIDAQLAVIRNYINQDRSLYDRASSMGIPVHELPCGSRLDISTARALLEHARQTRARCIHTHDYKSHLYGLVAAKRLGLPLVATLHGWISNTGALKTYQKIERVMLWLFDAVVTVSPVMEKRLGSGIPALYSVRTILNGVDTRQFHPPQEAIDRRHTAWPEDACIFTSIGRLSKEKGHTVLLQAFSKVRSSQPRSRLLIVGEGPERGNLQQQIQTLGLSASVTLAGTRTDINTVLQSTDCYVSSSYTEGMPMVVLEAMACARPVVATDVGAVATMLGDGAGILVPAADPEALALAMLDVCNDEASREKMGDKARQRCVASYSADAQAQAYRALYRELGL